jgi:hypothetical protein
VIGSLLHFFLKYVKHWNYDNIRSILFTFSDDQRENAWLYPCLFTCRPTTGGLAGELQQPAKDKYRIPNTQ